MSKVRILLKIDDVLEKLISIKYIKFN